MIFIGRQIENQEPIDTRGPGFFVETRKAKSVERVHVSIEHDGYLRPAPNRAHAIEHALRRRARFERTLGGELVYDPVRERIGKRDTELEDVHPGLFERKGERLSRGEARIAGRDVGDERLPAAFPQPRKCFVDPIHARCFREARAL